MTMDYARKLIGDECKDLKIIFSNDINGVNGSCYPFIRKIVYCDGYMRLNRNNFDALKYTVVEECVHLVHVCHDENFYNTCRKLGTDVSKPPAGTKFYWRYFKRCNSCGNSKFYHVKPRGNICKKCGHESTIFFGNVIE